MTPIEGPGVLIPEDQIRFVIFSDRSKSNCYDFWDRMNARLAKKMAPPQQQGQVHAVLRRLQGNAAAGRKGDFDIELCPASTKSVTSTSRFPSGGGNVLPGSLMVRAIDRRLHMTGTLRDRSRPGTFYLRIAPSSGQWILAGIEEPVVILAAEQGRRWFSFVLGAVLLAAVVATVLARRRKRA